MSRARRTAGAGRGQWRSDAVILAIVAALLFGQTAPVTSPGKLTQRQFKRMSAAKQIVLVDVRTKTEFTDGHIPGAISMSFASINWMPEYDGMVETFKAAKKPVVLYCACRGESQALRAADILIEHGLTDVRVLVGGWNDWFNQNNRIAKGTR